jgi:hypothetical protein
MERSENDSRSSSTSSSIWSHDDQHSSAPSVETISLNPPPVGTSSFNATGNGSSESNVENDIANVPVDQERQILLLMLLAQVW